MSKPPLSLCSALRVLVRGPRKADFFVRKNGTGKDRSNLFLRNEKNDNEEQEKIFMQTKQQKEEIVSQVTECIQTSKSVVFAGYAGLTVKESMELQREMRKMGGSLRVMKKTLLSIALRSVGVSLDAKTLPGQIVTAFSPDEVSAAKTLVEFSKKHKALVVSAGTLGEKVLSTEEVLALSKLPSLTELRAKLAGTLQAPIAGFARTLSGNISGLVRVLQQVSEQKSA